MRVREAEMTLDCLQGVFITFFPAVANHIRRVYFLFIFFIEKKQLNSTIQHELHKHKTTLVNSTFFFIERDQVLRFLFYLYTHICRYDYYNMFLTRFGCEDCSRLIRSHVG